MDVQVVLALRGFTLRDPRLTRGFQKFQKNSHYAFLTHFPRLTRKYGVFFVKMLENFEKIFEKFVEFVSTHQNRVKILRMF